MWAVQSANFQEGIVWLKFVVQAGVLISRHTSLFLGSKEIIDHGFRMDS